MKLSEIQALAEAAEDPHYYPDDTDVIMLGHQAKKLISMVRRLWSLKQAEELEIEMDMPITEEERDQIPVI